MTSLPPRTSSAKSSASDSSQADFSSPLARSTSRLEPILTTMRRALVHSARAAVHSGVGRGGAPFSCPCERGPRWSYADCLNAYQIWVRLDQPGARRRPRRTRARRPQPALKEGQRRLDMRCVGLAHAPQPSPGRGPGGTVTGHSCLKGDTGLGRRPFAQVARAPRCQPLPAQGARQPPGRRWPRPTRPCASCKLRSLAAAVLRACCSCSSISRTLRSALRRAARSRSSSSLWARSPEPMDATTMRCLASCSWASCKDRSAMRWALRSSANCSSTARRACSPASLAARRVASALRTSWSLSGAAACRGSVQPKLALSRSANTCSGLPNSNPSATGISSSRLLSSRARCLRRPPWPGGRQGVPRIISAEIPDVAFRITTGIAAPRAPRRVEVQDNLGARRHGAVTMRVGILDVEVANLRLGAADLIGLFDQPPEGRSPRRVRP